jgi:hypothetical protein
MKIDFQDRIDDYLLDRMSDEERKSFESDAAENVELKEQLKFTETVNQATKSRNEKLAAMAEWKDDYEWEEDRFVAASAAEYRPTGSGYNYCPAPEMENRRVATSSPIKKMLYWVSGIAAVFIVGVFVFNLYRPSSPEMSSSEIAMETASRPNEAPSKNGNVSFRGRSHNLNIESQLAMGDYSKALVRLEKDEADIRADLMLIDRELHSRGESREDAMNDKDSLETNLVRVLYLKAQALIGLDRKGEAQVVLDEIRHSKSDYGIKADSLYHLLQ